MSKHGSKVAIEGDFHNYREAILMYEALESEAKNSLGIVWRRRLYGKEGGVARI